MKYIYEGPVTVFGRCVTAKWHGETIANSEAKARSNLAYKFKKEININVTSKVALPGLLIKEEN